MAVPVAKADLMHALGRLVRGLSTLFWGLPVALVVFGMTWIQTVSEGSHPNALAEWLDSLGLVPPLVTAGLLFFGVWQLAGFQPQERVWQAAVDRAKVVAMVNLGLSPFLHWWHRLPFVPFYAMAVAFLLFFSLIFLIVLNQVIVRLAAMLPDETLRVETRFFSALNLYLLILILVVLVGYFGVQQTARIPPFAIWILRTVEAFRQWVLLFMVLVPVAMTMTLIWKIKEVILTSVFQAGE